MKASDTTRTKENEIRRPKMTVGNGQLTNSFQFNTKKLHQNLLTNF